MTAIDVVIVTPVGNAHVLKRSHHYGFCHQCGWIAERWQLTPEEAWADAASHWDEHHSTLPTRKM